MQRERIGCLVSSFHYVIWVILFGRSDSLSQYLVCFHLVSVSDLFINKVSTDLCVMSKICMEGKYSTIIVK